MAIKKYEKDGTTFWQVYLNLRSKTHARIRFQKRINGLSSEKEARVLEKKLLREISEEIVKEESKGLTWGEIVERWVRQQELFPTRRLGKATLNDYEAILRNWTASWFNRPAAELNRADGREVLNKAKACDRSTSFQIHLKSVINTVFTWAIEERFVTGVQHSPVFGVEIEVEREEKKPEILTAEEIRILLRKAREQRHPWYPIWVGAVLTGCRSGELHQLKKSDLELLSREQAIAEDKKSFDKRRYGYIRVRRSWNKRFRQVGPTKAGYWRTVPISSEFYWFMIHDLNVENKKPEDFLFPRRWEWDRGTQAEVLRGFCIANNLPSIKFHTLRACFATQLISIGIPATVVMKICGWREYKTMQRYVRLAGIDEAGATESLKFIPTEEAVLEKVVHLYDYREEK